MLYTQCVGEAFVKNSNWVMSGSTVRKFVFVVCTSRDLPKYIKTKVLATCVYLI